MKKPTHKANRLTYTDRMHDLKSIALDFQIIQKLLKSETSLTREESRAIAEQAQVAVEKLELEIKRLESEWKTL